MRGDLTLGFRFSELGTFTLEEAYEYRPGYRYLIPKVIILVFAYHP